MAVVFDARSEDLGLKRFGWVRPALLRHHRRVALRRRATMIALGLVLLLMSGLAPQGPVGQLSPAIAGDWRLKFDDEFNGATLDKRKWGTTYPWGARTNAANRELEYYADDAFQLSAGVLRIRAQRRTAHGFKYTSGIITSHASFAPTYGYFEIRAKVPKGRGLWPAFWLAPKDMTWPPEIDILEMAGSSPKANLMVNHYKTALGPQQTFTTWTGPDFSKDFHTFGLEWTPKQLVWYIDGVEHFQTSAHIPAQPMYMIVNLAVGGSHVGPPDSTTRFPCYLQVAYIRVYQRS
jgi:beta-glucanase (GH16 family)